MAKRSTMTPTQANRAIWKAFHANQRTTKAYLRIQRESRKACTHDWAKIKHDPQYSLREWHCWGCGAYTTTKPTAKRAGKRGGKRGGR